LIAHCLVIQKSQLDLELCPERGFEKGVAFGRRAHTERIWGQSMDWGGKEQAFMHTEFSSVYSILAGSKWYTC